MCGIFGYVGKRDNVPVLIFEGLKTLEYRGYDSWGITIKDGPFLDFEKHVGKIGDNKLTLAKNKSKLGIGHTRWATHGGVSVKNAHPHLDCTKKIAVLHNGIIENFAKLKEELIKKGHIFYSETDTEVVPHLIEEYLKTQDFTKSVQSSFKRLEGLNAIVVAYAPSSEIIAAKTGSPLVIGKGEDEFFIASDILGIIKYTNKILFLKDNEMVVLGKKIQLFSLPSGKSKQPSFQSVDWKIEEANLGSFPHFMIKEIYDQPKVIINIAQNYKEEIKKLSSIIAKAKGTFFIGAGTAYHAALGGTYLFSKIAKEHINTAVASEFNYLEDFLTSKSLIIALSQSGETIDVVEPLTRAKKKGSTIVSITNSLGSSIYRMSDHKLMLGAGPEKAVASTKAYLAKLAVLLMLSFALKKNVDKAGEILIKTAEEIKRILETKNLKKIKDLAHLLSSSEHMYVIGRGFSYSSALEAALKIKEVSYIHTEGLAGGELKHGTIALISEGTPCLVFAPKDDTYQSILSNAIEIKSRGGLIIGISPENSPVFDYWLEVKDLSFGSYLAQSVPAQLLAYYIAANKNLDPDKPRNLAKSVTVK
jgi:glucosamine--fructose-6-phosphate aminotransferase (isomerizing)